MALTTSEINEPFQRCPNCKGTWFEIKKSHQIRKDSFENNNNSSFDDAALLINKTKIIVVCVMCTSKYTNGKDLIISE